MKNWLQFLVMISLFLMIGCVAVQHGRDTRTMSDVKNIYLAKIDAEKDTGETPSLEAIGRKLSMDISNFEITEYWNALMTEANDVILREKKPVDGRRVVLYASGEVALSSE